MFEVIVDIDNMKGKEMAGDPLKDGLSERKPLQRPWEKGMPQTSRQAYVAPNDNGGMEDGY